MDAISIARLLTAVVWFANGIVRIAIYNRRRDWIDILIASLNFICAIFFAASAYDYFTNL